MARPRIAIIGAGRMGQGLGLALQRRGYSAALFARSERPVAASLLLQTGDITAVTTGAEVVIIATPDDAVTSVARQLVEAGAVSREQSVLHISGLLDHTALLSLRETKAGLGSMHPLQTLADPATAVERLQGVYATIEGDEPALQQAERLARSLKMIPVRIEASAKPRYHAAASLVANYTTVLAAIAERVAREAGVSPEIARKIYLPLLKGAVDNLVEFSPVAALTGPIRRGDLATVGAHLEALQGEDRRVYVELGRAALALAREGGLEESQAVKMEALLNGAAATAR
ncbi:MAG TPA: Rossmann-like and DUF2520 domain-containing protein [Gemmatimonadales bacterium]|nr:Rossmann-like and DUF2520 domain-containing protein [Gemmatimonadales bacterium]